MLRLYGGHTERFAVSFLAIGTAALALTFIAAWSEGRAPRTSTIYGIVPALTANLAGAWTIARWRHAGGDIAVAALGHSPIPHGLFVIALTLPILAWSQSPVSSKSQWALTLSPGAVRVDTPQGTTRYTWSDDGAHRWDEGQDSMQFADFPPPTSASPPPRKRTPWLLAALRCLAAILALGWLGLKKRPPGLSGTLTVGTGGFVAGIALVHLVSNWPV